MWPYRALGSGLGRLGAHANHPRLPSGAPVQCPPRTAAVAYLLRAGISIRSLVAHTPPPLPFIIIKAKRGIGARRSPRHINYKHFCTRTVAHQCARRASGRDLSFSGFFKPYAFYKRFCPRATRALVRALVRAGRALVRQCSPRHMNYKHFCTCATSHQCEHNRGGRGRVGTTWCPTKLVCTHEKIALATNPGNSLHWIL